MRAIYADAALDALRKCQTYLYDARDPELKIELSSAEAAINNLPTIQTVATDTNVGATISKFIDGLEEIFADLRERHVDDSVCGLCEYDGAYMGQSGDWCNECPGFERDDCFKLSDKTRKEWTEEIIKALPTVQPEPQWIPCEERMPEKTPLWKTVGYLATVTCDSWKESQTMYVKWETTTVRGKEVSRWTFDNRLFPSEWRVVAWMTMPEAYKEGGERI